MSIKKNMKRRDFLSSTAAAAATFSIVPRHVLGGEGHVAPSDKITIANIGCGTQGLREMPGLLQHPDLQVVAVCDPVKVSTDYLDWSAHGIRNGIRNTLGAPEWGRGYREAVISDKSMLKNTMAKINLPGLTKGVLPTRITGSYLKMKGI